MTPGSSPGGPQTGTVASELVIFLIQLGDKANIYSISGHNRLGDFGIYLIGILSASFSRALIKTLD